MLNQLIVEEIIRHALKEDMNYGDVTSDTLIPLEAMAMARMTAKEDGVIAGLAVAEMAFKTVDSTLSFVALKKDGDTVKKGDHIAEIKGSTRGILKAERLALNLIQRMSGIATLSKAYADEIEGYPTRVVDTRKTTPGLRVLEKYAVKVGGCHNHRFNLSDAVMIKDNHIKAVGSITKAIEMARQSISHTMKIEVEVESLAQLQEALEVKADIIMLDNMDTDTMRDAVKITGGRAILEASGNITKERLREIAAIGIDVISVGALTHSIKSLDISLNIIK
ncbi:carboxylating nicotinate-nucleotide diphosphorylase [Anaerosolibacter sp.]|uniref:carboxylating nicotinate-nucleotide diphosphorylase n=1 Tax=Anaerosolibacter sp. TaxID=1872527 RepID=UPI0039EDFEEF